MTSCLREFALYPPPPIEQKAVEQGVLKCDVAHRSSICATFILLALGLVFIGVAYAGKAHPIVGAALMLGSAIPMSITCSITRNSNLDQLYKKTT